MRMTIIRIACAMAALIAMIFLFGESDSLIVTVITKVVGLALMLVGVKGYERTMTEEEWGEKA